MEKESMNLVGSTEKYSRTSRSNSKSSFDARGRSTSPGERQSLLGSPYKKIPSGDDYDLEKLRCGYTLSHSLGPFSTEGSDVTNPNLPVTETSSYHADSKDPKIHVNEFSCSSSSCSTNGKSGFGNNEIISNSSSIFHVTQDSAEKVPKGDQNDEDFKESYAPQFFAALAANFGSFALGTVLSWTSPALPDLRERKTIGEITDIEETWISSIALLGAAASCPIVGLVIERFGRRKCMLLLTPPFVLGWLLIIFAQNIWMMYVGRFVTGFCGGGCSIAVPVYITETASVKIRGMLASGFDMLITVGILYIFIVGTYVNWQWQAVACGLIPIVFFVLMIAVPESPRYLVEVGRHADAQKALSWLRGVSSSSSAIPATVQSEMDELVKSVEESNEKSSASWKDILQDKSILKPTIIALMLMVFQQLAALDAVMFYTVDIFREAGTDIDENLSANIVGGVQVLATVTAALFVDHSGRRFLLLVSEIGMVISLTAMGVFFYLKQQNNDQVPPNLGWLPLASLMVLCIAFSVGMGPLPWLLMGELLPPNVKGLGSGLVTITRWILGFVVTIAFKQIMQQLGSHGGYWLFAVCCFFGTIFVYFCVPETNGKTLDEIQLLFKPKSPTRNTLDEESNGKNSTTSGRYQLPDPTALKI